MNITKLYTVITDSLNPYSNLALEAKLLERCGPQDMMLYLWQNRRTVVIGRNQSAYRECRVALLEQEGGHLARRLSGGGAVYHDLGNLNFTFVTWKDNLSLEKQLGVILGALKSLGIEAGFSGRNDILLNGRKFSGNAFYNTAQACYHHGTLMVDVDLDKVTRYLSASSAKLKANGVDSVRSRVINLKEARADLSIAMMKEALISALEQSYGLPAEPLVLEADPGMYASREWLFRKEVESNYELSRRCPFGEVTMKFVLAGGRIQDISVFTDAMADDFCAPLEQLLKGLPVQNAAAAVEASDLSVRKEIGAMLEELA